MPTSTREPRGRVGWNVAIPQWKPPDGDSSDDDSQKAPKNRRQKSGKIITAASLDDLENGFQELPQLQPFQEDLVIPDDVILNMGDRIVVRLNKCCQADGDILSISNRMKSYYVSYDDLPSCFDEFQPKDCTLLQDDTNGSSTNAVVLCKLGGQGKVRFFCLNSCGFYRKAHQYFFSLVQPRQAVVQLSKCATFYHVQLHVGEYSVKRWICRDSIVDKIDESSGDKIDESSVDKIEE